MAASPPQHPEWSGLEVNQVEMQNPAPQLSEDGAEKIPHEGPALDHFAQDKMMQNGQTTYNGNEAIAQHPNQKMLCGVDRSAGSVHTSHDPSEEKELKEEPNSSKAISKPKKSRQRLWILLGVIALIAVVVVVVPCAVLLPKRNSTQDAAAATPSADPNTINTNNTVHDNEPDVAMNGTKIAAFLPPTNEGELWMYWQGVTGDIRVSKMYSNGSWASSQSMNISNAANGTSLTIAAHSWVGTGGNNNTLNHLVFETNDGFYADLINDPTDTISSGLWSDGGLYGLRRQSPLPGPRVNSAWAMCSNGTGFLFHGGSTNGWWNEWAYVPQTRTWQDFQFQFSNSSAYGGGVSQQDGDETILYLVTPKGRVVGWYRDLSDQSQFDWQRMSNDNSIEGVWPNSSLAMPSSNTDPRNVYYQDSSGLISLARANGTDGYSIWNNQAQTNMQPIGGSSMHAEAFNDGQNNITHFFFQTADNANGISHYSSTNTTIFDFVENVPI